MEGQSYDVQLAVPDINYAGAAQTAWDDYICPVLMSALAIAILGFFIRATFTRKTARRIQKGIDLISAMEDNHSDEES